MLQSIFELEIHEYEGFKVLRQLFSDLAMLSDSFLHKNIKHMTS
jgi:hypothetical protein